MSETEVFGALLKSLGPTGLVLLFLWRRLDKLGTKVENVEKSVGAAVKSLVKDIDGIGAKMNHQAERTAHIEGRLQMRLDETKLKGRPP